MNEGNWVASLRSSKFLLTLLIVLVSGYFVKQFLSRIGGPERIMDIYGIWAPIVTVVIFVVLNLSAYPVDIIAVANGAIYGVYLGATLTWVARMIVAVIEYRMGEQGAEDLDLDAKLKKVPWLARVPASHPIFLIGIRYLPYGGGHLVNLIAGSKHVPLRRHLWTSAIAIALAAVMLALIGDAMV